MPGSELLGVQPGSILLGADVSPPVAFSRTFSTGLTDTGTVVTADLSTGKAGGQSAIGGTANGESLTLKSTSAGTKAKINFGAAGLSYYDENAEQTGGASVNDTLLRVGTRAGATLCVMDFAINGTRQAAILANTFGTLELSGAAYIFTISNFATYVQVVTANANVQIGGSGAGLPSDPAASTLQLQSVKTVASAAGALWDAMLIVAGTLTLSGSTNVTELAVGRMQQSTMTAGSVLTVTDAATLTIDGPPLASGSLAFGTADNASGAKALWVKSGIARFDGGLKLKTNLGIEGVGGSLVLTAGNGDVNLVATGAGNTVKIGGQGIVANGVVATAMSSLGPAGSHTTIQEWLTVKNSAGTLRFIPLF